MKRKVATLFKELCCSQCKEDFDENSVVIMREEEEMIVIKMICQHCKKSFGVAFLGISDFDLKNYPSNEEDFVLYTKEIADPISEDEVLDAHRFIKDLDVNWLKFINELNK